MLVSDSRVSPAASRALSAGRIGRISSSLPSSSWTVIELEATAACPHGSGTRHSTRPDRETWRGALLAVAVGLLAQRARHDEADPGALVVDRAGLVVDQPELLRRRHEVHLVHVAVVAALAGQDPEVARVAHPRAVLGEAVLALLERLDHHDRAVHVAGAHQPSAERLLDVAPQGRAHVAGHLDALVGLHAQLLDDGAVAVVGVGRHVRGDYAEGDHPPAPVRRLERPRTGTRRARPPR